MADQRYLSAHISPEFVILIWVIKARSTSFYDLSCKDIECSFVLHRFLSWYPPIEMVEQLQITIREARKLTLKDNWVISKLKRKSGTNLI